jgi:hypothetical protein
MNRIILLLPLSFVNLKFVPTMNQPTPKYSYMMLVASSQLLFCPAEETELTPWINELCAGMGFGRRLDGQGHHLRLSTIYPSWAAHMEGYACLPWSRMSPWV